MFCFSKILRFNKIKSNVLACINYLKLSINERNALLLNINKYNKITHHAFTTINLTNYINKVLNQEYFLQFVRKFMKEDEKFIFKKVKPRPNNFDFN